MRTSLRSSVRNSGLSTPLDFLDEPLQGCITLLEVGFRIAIAKLHCSTP